MTPARIAIDSLNRDYLEMRSRLLDLAAALDRIDTAGSPQAARSDPRMTKLLAGLRVLADGNGDRAERVQRVFSQPYEEGWLAQWRMANK
jgi:hypothetical protein